MIDAPEEPTTLRGKLRFLRLYWGTYYLLCSTDVLRFVGLHGWADRLYDYTIGDLHPRKGN